MVLKDRTKFAITTEFAIRQKAFQPIFRHLPQIGDIYHQPLLELVFQAASVHRQFFDPKEVQQSTLLSIKTGRVLLDST